MVGQVFEKFLAKLWSIWVEVEEVSEERLV